MKKVIGKHGNNPQATAKKRVKETATPAIDEYGRPPVIPFTIPKTHYPNKHAPGSLKRGDVVWYGGQKYYVENAQLTWDKGTHVRIGSKLPHPDPLYPLPVERESFYTHADNLLITNPNRIPVVEHTMKVKAVNGEKKVRTVRDVGDEVAKLLRETKDIYAVAAKYLDVKPDALHKKYGHLNPGQQRMCLGNKMRAHGKSK
jgi:hypothetical protein